MNVLFIKKILSEIRCDTFIHQEKRNKEYYKWSKIHDYSRVDGESPNIDNGMYVSILEKLDVPGGVVVLTSESPKDKRKDTMNLSSTKYSKPME